MPTRGQVKRALVWEAFLAVPRLKRGNRAPPCVTCGAEASHEFAKGEPAYACQHPPLVIDPETMERARVEFGRVVWHPPEPRRRKGARKSDRV